MPPTLIIVQILNGLQYGLMLFLLASGLTLVFGIMDMINLAHGSLYMIGAYLTAAVTAKTGSFWLGLLVAAIGTAIIGMLLEVSILRKLYERDHLSQVLATFGIILISNEAVRMIWGPRPLRLDSPEIFSGPTRFTIMDLEIVYPSYRLFLIVVGIIIAIALFIIVNHTRVGMWVRAGASNREMAAVMGVPINALFTVIFGLGAALSAIAGGVVGPLIAVEIGMGEDILILTFVVIIIGGIGSIRGAFIASILVGVSNTAGRVLLPLLLREYFERGFATNVGGALSAMLIYVLMAAILFWRPQGLFPVRS